MSATNRRVEPPDLTYYEENIRRFPQEELAKYGGKHIAWSPDGTRIVASGYGWEGLLQALDDAGIPMSQVISDYVPREDEDSWLL